MPTYQRADKAVEQLATEVLCEYPEHTPILNARVKIDYVFAFATVDDNGVPTGHALTKNGLRALGICRKVPLKDRAMGRGDVEIALDGDWWPTAALESRKALLDHELYHVEIREDRHGNVQKDDLNRPMIELRPHDFEVGWFAAVSARHGEFSIERQQAKNVMDIHHKAFWPQLELAL